MFLNSPSFLEFLRTRTTLEPIDQHGQPSSKQALRGPRHGLRDHRRRQWPGRDDGTRFGCQRSEQSLHHGPPNGIYGESRGESGTKDPLACRATPSDVSLRQINQTVVPIVCDITSKEELQAAVTTIEGQTRFVNAVVANSGALGPITATGPRADDETIDSIYEQFWNTSMTQSQEVLNINVLGSFFTFVAFMKLLEAGNTHPESRGKTDFIQSQFITITSLSGLGRRENVGHAYMASKAALVHLTKSLATIFGPRGIRANSIAPGIYLTEMTEVSSLLVRSDDC